MTTFPALTEAEGKLELKRSELAGIFAEAGPTIDLKLVKSVSGDSHAIAEHIRKLNDEMADLGAEVKNLQAVGRAAAEVANPTLGQPDPETGERKGGSFGELFTKSQAFKGRQGSNGPVANIDIELKTLMTTTAGWAPETTRTGRVVDFATRPIQVTDVVPTGQTSQNSVVYMEETTFTNSAAETAEGGTYAESALALTERTSPVQKIATFLPVTDEQLEDEPAVRSYLDNRLPFMLRQRLDSQILVGNGTSPNLRGFLNVVGIQTQAKGADPTPDAIYKAMVKVRVTGRATPGAIIIHPNDWQDVRLLRTADGLYIWGNPSDKGAVTIWGLPVVETDAITEGTGLVGDFANFTELTSRRGIDVQVSNSHSTFFVEGKQAIRADLRTALVTYRPTALCTITGI